MGQKVNPHGLRVGVIKNWDSRWYAPDEKFGDILVQDYKIREYLKKTLLLQAFPRSKSNATTQVRLQCSFTVQSPVS